MNFINNIRKFILPALFILVVVVSFFKPEADSLSNIADRIQNRIADSESCFQKISRDSKVINALRDGNVSQELTQRLKEQNLSLFLYSGNNLLHWTDNTVIPPAFLSSLNTGTGFMKLKNGWYLLMKSTDGNQGETLAGLVPVKYAYPFENRFLKNEFAPGIDAPGNVEVTDQKIPGSVYVKNAAGETLFGLYFSGKEADREVNFPLLLAQLVMLLLGTYYMRKLLHRALQQFGFAVAFVAMIVVLVAARAVMTVYELPQELYHSELFNPKYYASSAASGSLGELVINTLLLLWVVLFYLFHSPVAKHVKSVWFQTPLRVILIFLFSALITWVFKTLVMDSIISFEVYNVLSLSLYSIIGLFIFSLLLILHFLFTRHVLNYLLSRAVPALHVAIWAAVAASLFSLAAIGSPFSESIVAAAVWTFLLIVFLYGYLKRQSAFSAQSVILNIAVYSLLTTFLIENLYERRERNQREFFAGKLISERDYVAEYLFEDIAGRIAADAFVRNSFLNPLISSKEVSDRLTSLYLSGYFNKYDLQVYAVSNAGQTIRSGDSAQVAKLMNLINDTSEGRLHYVTDSTETYYYISLIEFRNDSASLGHLAVRFKPKIYYGQNVYPELLLGSNLVNSGNQHNYSYAVYQNDKLVAQSGEFPYTYRWNSDYSFGNETHLFLEEPDWEHGIMRFPNNKKVIVSVAREPLFEPVATFSYLFALLFMVALLFTALWHLWQVGAAGETWWSGFSFSFRTRINYSMLAMIVFSFIIIGIVTISFFRRQYDAFYSDKLLRKEKVVHAGLEYFIGQNSFAGESVVTPALQNALNYEVLRLAEINVVDINLFDTTGELLVASQPAIYDKGIISNRMNPDAYHNLSQKHEAQVNRQEKIGSLNYLATYAPLRSSEGNTIAYLGIPYFERAKDINEEVSGFLVALMNVYVFLLVCAAVLAYFISNSVTRPLTIISEKLRILNLNKKNEPIEWKSKDEIGVLISEYNKMIAELEKSAQKLARSERESAWREMAKQIAHEIKNPLTPMKLSIQYLQRAIADGKPNIDELALRVTKTLEEQIENLSSIATAFSSFAKMPRPENEIINLNELLSSICDLFSKDERVTVTFTTDADSPLVFADKNQLVSVFNNLVKNAIQSIPESRTGFVDVNVKEDDGLILVTVSDNGSGIPQDNYDKVFVPNFTTKSSGTGLGLAISKRIVDGAGGKIWFESAENVGTAFFVRLNKVEE